MSRRKWELTMLPCSESFGYQFSGFVDGEGCFSISPTRKNGYVCAFCIKLRADDRSTLEWIQNELQIGNITTGEHSGPGFGNPWVRWTVSKKDDLVKLTEVFDAFPLRSKKQRDYEIWRDAAIHWAFSDKPVDWAPVAQAKEELRTVRAYA